MYKIKVEDAQEMPQSRSKPSGGTKRRKIGINNGTTNILYKIKVEDTQELPQYKQQAFPRYQEEKKEYIMAQQTQCTNLKLKIPKNCHNHTASLQDIPREEEIIGINYGTTNIMYKIKV